MKVCLYGAGAIGGLLGVHLATAGAEVSVVDAGPVLRAIQEKGLRVEEGGAVHCAKVRAVADPAELGPQDVVIVAVKGPTLSLLADRIGSLLGEKSVVLTAMNGVPWWFFHGFGGRYAHTHLKSVDPDGSVAAAIPHDKVLGCVIDLSCANVEPGLVHHVAGRKLTIGEPDNTVTPRVRQLAGLLDAAGFDTTVSPSIQHDIWFKMLGNITHNPISAITGATTDRIVDDPLTARLCVEVMAEAIEVGRRLGCVVHETPEQRNGATRKLGAFKTSMLQDVEAGKAVELDALIGAVSEIARIVGVPVPFTDALLGLARLKARVLGLYPETEEQPRVATA